MFEQLGRYHVQSSWGFEVKFWTQATQMYVEYREGDHVLRYDNTRNASVGKEAIFTILPDYIDRWLPPFLNEDIARSKKKTIIENMASALDFLGISTNVLDPHTGVIAEFEEQGWVWKSEEWRNA